jgi:hypothetical protein
VSKHSLHSLDVCAGRDGEAGGGVPQVVRRERGEAGSFNGGIEDVIAEVLVAKDVPR